MNEPNEAAVLAAKGEVRELVPGNAEASTCLPATAASSPEPQQAAPMQPHEAALIGDASADAGELEAAPAADEAATESEDGIRDSGFRLLRCRCWFNLRGRPHAQNAPARAARYESVGGEPGSVRTSRSTDEHNR